MIWRFIGEFSFGLFFLPYNIPGQQNKKIRL